MYIECICICMIVLAISVIFLRRGKKDWALLVLPLLFVPAATLISTGLLRVVSFPSRSVALQSQIIFILCALIAACLLMGFASLRLRSPRSRLSFLVVSGGFTVVLTWLCVRGPIFSL